MKQQELLEQVASHLKLSTDADFRSQFLSNPKHFLNQEFRTNFGEEVKVIAHENNAEKMHVILLPAEELVFNEDIEEKVETVLDKAITNESFKNLLMSDPKGTLTKELPDYFIPSDFKVYFHENTDTEVHVLLPQLETSDDELSEAELDAVAGGKKRRGPHIGRKRGGKAPKCRSQKFRRR